MSRSVSVRSGWNRNNACFVFSCASNLFFIATVGSTRSLCFNWVWAIRMVVARSEERVVRKNKHVSFTFEQCWNRWSPWMLRALPWSSFPRGSVSFASRWSTCQILQRLHVILKRSKEELEGDDFNPEWRKRLLDRRELILTEQEHFDFVAQYGTVAFELGLDALVGLVGFPIFCAKAATHVVIFCVCWRRMGSEWWSWRIWSVLFSLREMWKDCRGV